MTNDPLGVTISAREIYDQIVGLRDEVRSLVHSNDVVANKLTDHEDRIRNLEKLPEDTGERLRAIERWKYSVPAAAITALVSASVTLFKSTGGP